MGTDPVWLKVWPQYVLPHHALSRIMHALTRVHGGPLSRAAMRGIIKRFNVNMDEAEQQDLRGFRSFNEFFTRRLKADARPMDASEDAFVCPVDGAVSQAGAITDGRIFQAKGHDYSAAELIGDEELAQPFMNGEFATLYLSPRDYHRIHMPCDGRLTDMLHVPGRLFSVNPLTTRNVSRVFARNERVVCLFESESFGRFAMVLVGAIFVASIETVWAGEITPPAGRKIRRWRYGKQEPAGEVILKKGEEMGRFNMGSTVILLTEPGAVRWAETLKPEADVKLHARIGTRAD